MAAVRDKCPISGVVTTAALLLEPLRSVVIQLCILVSLSVSKYSASRLSNDSFNPTALCSASPTPLVAFELSGLSDKLSLFVSAITSVSLSTVFGNSSGVISVEWARTVGERKFGAPPDPRTKRLSITLATVAISDSGKSPTDSHIFLEGS